MNVKEVEEELQRRLREERNILGQIPRVHCRDGLELSVQASETHYCVPKDNEGPWSLVEVAVPTRFRVTKLRRFSEGRPSLGLLVHSFVPVQAVAEVITARGGFA